MRTEASDQFCVSLSPSAFAHVAALVRRETAMVYEPGKEYLVEARLRPLARQAGCGDLDAYVALLPTDPAELRRAIEALTITETYWFRDLVPYQVLAERILPWLLAERTRTRHLRIWSAACSSGQEAYSIAILLRELLPIGWSAEILATDVNDAMLARVRDGRYNDLEMRRGMPRERLATHFHEDPVSPGGWEIVPELKAMVQTRQLNLAAALPALPTFDVVFLRNVLIYFDHDVRRSVLDRVRAQVCDDGYVVLGSAEAGMDVGEQWSRDTVARLSVLRPAAAPATARSAS